jgi:hypothetical protein
MTSRLDAFKGTDSPQRTALKASVKSARANAGMAVPRTASSAPKAGMVKAPSASDGAKILGAGAAAGAANAILDHKNKQKAILDSL